MADMNNNKKNEATEQIEETATTEMVEVVGINFREAGKIYYFAPGCLKFELGNKVIVETSRGVEMGTVKVPNKSIPASEIEEIRTITLSGAFKPFFIYNATSGIVPYAARFNTNE